ncbi:MAG: hypothetical protein MRY63_08350 [Neomegalonema sp.]|nr:hypothetical protein [Neomegalonema sp.]
MRVLTAIGGRGGAIATLGMGLSVVLGGMVISGLLFHAARAGGEEGAATPSPAPQSQNQSAAPSLSPGEVVCFLDGSPLLRWRSDSMDQLQWGGVGSAGGSVAVFGSEDAGSHMRSALAIYEANTADGKKLICAASAERLNVQRLR